MKKYIFSFLLSLIFIFSIASIASADENQPPVADPGGPYIADCFYEGLTLDGSFSEGSDLMYTWDVCADWEGYSPSEFPCDNAFNDGVGPSPNIYFDEAGLYQVQLKVTDADGYEDTAETTITVYDPHMVVVPQDNHIAGVSWHEGMELTLSIFDPEIGEFQAIATRPVHEPEEGVSEDQRYMADFQLNDYGIDEILPRTLFKIVGVVGDTTVSREHVVRDFWFDVDYESDEVFGGSELRTPVPPEENYVRVRVEEPVHLEILAWADENGYWEADFGTAGIDLTEETRIVVLQQNYYDSSHTFLYVPEGEPPEEPQPHFIVQPDHGWVSGMDWPLGVDVTLVIDEDMDPGNGIIYTATAITVPAEWDPNIGMVNFQFEEIADLVQPGQYVSMTDGETTKDTFIYDMAFETLDPLTEIASGYGPANRPGHVHIQIPDTGYDYDLPAEENDGTWTADFSDQGIDFSAIEDANVELWDDDGDGTMAHLWLGPRFLGGEIVPNPVPVGESVTITANYLEGYFPIEGMEFTFFQYDEFIWHPFTEVSSNQPVTGTVTYTFEQPGVYPVGTRALFNQEQESDGFLGFVVVYDPEDGFVTGGGSIWSPQGAYTPDPDLEGKATFGFVSKYKKGASVPTGQTEFQFKVADLNFHSSSYDWLVVAGKKAIYKGVGMINGEGEYKFMISAIDGDLLDGDGIDKFRIRIWEEADGMEIVIYDNQLGDWLGLDADPSTALLSGSIVIHKSK